MLMIIPGEKAGTEELLEAVQAMVVPGTIG